MNENRRIFWNIIATYGRSIYGLVIGLLCGRWALLVLGEADYGLLGLISGLTCFIGFINWVLEGAISRFYAVSVGAFKVAEDKNAALDECRRWFNAALVIHTAIPLAITLVGYPIGVWSIGHFLNIQSERIQDCIWVFRCVCISNLVGMLVVPYSAMYTAKQYIAELTIYSFATTTLHTIALYIMLHNPRDWFVAISVWGCFLAVGPQLIIAIRALKLFPECHIQFEYMRDLTRLKRICSYSSWQLLGTIAYLLRQNGMAIVINKLFGASMNAAMAIGNNVQGHCNTLASAMQRAFSPAITQAYGAKEFDKMRTFAMRTCKFNILLSLIFVIPLSLELPEVMRLWLKNPPAYSIGLCWCAMIIHLIESSTEGHNIIINATGQIAGYNSCNLGIFSISIILCAIAGYYSKNIYVVMGILAFFWGFFSVVRVFFARYLVKLSIRYWFYDVVLKSIVVIILSIAIGYLPHIFMKTSFLRICITTALCELIFLPLSWFVLLSDIERHYLYEKIISKYIHIYMKNK